MSSYFNGSFQKAFLGTHASQTATGGVDAGVSEGFLLDAGIRSIDLNDTAAPFALGIGTYGFFDPATNLSVDASFVAGSCCPLYLAGASLLTNDKIGPFAGGYTETNKSKLINPKYITKFYRVDPCEGQNAVVHIGSTPATAAGATLTFNNLSATAAAYTPSTTFTNVATTGGTGTGLTVNVVVNGAGTIAAIGSITRNNPGIGYTIGDTITIDGSLLGGTTPGEDVTFDVLTITTATADCCKQFLCDETYNLRLDIKGSPALRYLTRDTYYTSGAYTGCCDATAIAPEPVDATKVFILWAQDFTTSPLISPFIQIIVWDQTGVPWFATGALAVAAGYPSTQTYDNYPETAYITDACAGMTIVGAYVDTKFNNCTFYPNDFYEKEPVRIYASEVDLNGDPCIFTGICVVDECPPRQGQGFGETVLRDLILSESYRQNFVATNMDLRIREITQGNDIVDSVNRNGLFYKYYLEHVVPRFNNPSGVFDNDRYLLEIITAAPSTGLEAFMVAWLDNCSDCDPTEVHACVETCTPTIPFI